jgi:homoserine trans-succinylase
LKEAATLLKKLQSWKNEFSKNEEEIKKEEVKREQKLKTMHR